jgi:hypothetical protein
MHQNYTLAGPGEHTIELDDNTLSAIGGEGPLSTALRELGSIIWQCIKTGIDDVIAGAEEGYADAQPT